MRIGIITGEYPPMQGGVGAFSQILGQTLYDMGHTVRIFSSTEATSQNQDIPVEHTCGWGLKGLRNIRNWAEAEKLDVVNLQFQTAAYQMSPWIHFLPGYLRNTVPTVTTFHDLRVPYLFPKAGILREWIVMHLARHSAGAIVTNHEDYLRIAHLPDGALIPIGSNIIMNGDQHCDGINWRQRAKAGENDLLLAYFGFINHSKGVDTLFEAIAELHSRDIPVRLVMIGGRTGSSDPSNIAYSRQIEELAQKLQIESLICWTDYVADHEVACFLKSANLVVLPFRDGASYRRGTLMAAIHQGCTIVTTQPRVRIPEFSPATMMMVSANDPIALANAIEQLYQQPDICHQMRAKTIQLQDQFSWHTIAVDTLHLFEQISRKHNA